MNQYKGYRELECYKQGRLLRIFIAELVKSITFDEKYISGEELNADEEKCESVFRLINGYISYLDKVKQQGKGSLPDSQSLSS